MSRRLLTLDDVEFAFLYPKDFGKKEIGHLRRITESPFYEKLKFGIRVHRRNNIMDYKDFIPFDKVDTVS